MTAPIDEPLLVRRQDFRELRVLTDDEQNVVLAIGRPGSRGAPDELKLSISSTF